jgi:NAD(P)H-nitrite reductase large subunit
MVATQRHYVIVGASAAGMGAASAIREIDPTGPITVLSDEPDKPYFRPLIPLLIGGTKTASDMWLVGQGPYNGPRIDVRLNARVETVNTQDQHVTIGDGEQIPYHKLLIATGSRPHVPPDIQGTDTEGVFALRTMAHARAAAKRVKKAEQAVMLGGGLSNLKTAFALLEHNLDVTLIVRSPEVLSQLMEPRDAALIRDALINAGLKIETGCSATGIVATSHGVSSVVLDNGREIPSQIVCIGKGVRPNVALVDQSDINVDRGVVVDRFTASSVSHVFAAGDVAATFDSVTGERVITGLWTNAVEMGRCAGYNMAGRPTEYSGTFGILNATQIADQPFVSMGIVHSSGTEYETHVMVSSIAYRKLVFSPDGTKLVGLVLVGDISRAGLYRSIIRERTPIDKIKSHIINHTLHYGHFVGG